ncbi:MAG: hypothetical protein O2960_14625 [Verrucomicrobia bacterium]|nr:hypothetical protein [Verrucomicrobiota bacterium]
MPPTDILWLTVWTACGSGFGGLLGAIIFFIVRQARIDRKNKPTLVRQYFCVSKANIGQESEFEGDIKHHYGKVAEDFDKLGVNHPVWEWTRSRSGDKTGTAVLYGPYSTDFPQPGHYAVRFRICATGLPVEKHLQNDYPLIDLDVNQVRFLDGSEDTIETDKSETQEKVIKKSIEYHRRNFTKICRKFVFASELSDGQWHDFELQFHSDAEGQWEYRAFVNDGLHGRRDTMNDFGSSVRIFFDTVALWKLPGKILVT